MLYRTKMKEIVSSKEVHDSYFDSPALLGAKRDSHTLAPSPLSFPLCLPLSNRASSSNMLRFWGGLNVVGQSNQGFVCSRVIPSFRSNLQRTTPGEKFES